MNHGVILELDTLTLNMNDSINETEANFVPCNGNLISYIQCENHRHQGYNYDFIRYVFLIPLLHEMNQCEIKLFDICKEEHLNGTRIFWLWFSFV